MGLTLRQPDTARHARNRDRRTSCTDARANVRRLLVAFANDIRYVEINLTTDTLGVEVCVDFALASDFD